MKRILLTLIFAALVGCGATEEPTTPGPGTPDPDPSPSSPSGLIPQTYKISQCGGFDATSKGDFAPTDYCDAEVLK